MMRAEALLMRRAHGMPAGHAHDARDDEIPEEGCKRRLALGAQLVEVHCVRRSALHGTTCLGRLSRVRWQKMDPCGEGMHTFGPPRHQLTAGLGPRPDKTSARSLRRAVHERELLLAQTVLLSTPLSLARA